MDRTHSIHSSGSLNSTPPTGEDALQNQLPTNAPSRRNKNQAGKIKKNSNVSSSMLSLITQGTKDAVTRAAGGKTSAQKARTEIQNILDKCSPIQAEELDERQIPEAAIVKRSIGTKLRENAKSFFHMPVLQAIEAEEAEISARENHQVDPQCSIDHGEQDLKDIGDIIFDEFDFLVNLIDEIMLPCEYDSLANYYYNLRSSANAVIANIFREIESLRSVEKKCERLPETERTEYIEKANKLIEEKNSKREKLTEIMEDSEKHLEFMRKRNWAYKNTNINMDVTKVNKDPRSLYEKYSFSKKDGLKNRHRDFLESVVQGLELEFEHFETNVLNKERRINFYIEENLADLRQADTLEMKTMHVKLAYRIACEKYLINKLKDAAEKTSGSQKYTEFYSFFVNRLEELTAKLENFSKNNNQFPQYPEKDLIAGRIQLLPFENPIT